MGVKQLTINERIRWFRKDHLRVSQAEFAQVIGMKQTSVSTFERNGASVSDQIVKSICMAFSVNESWLRTGEGEILEQPETFSLDQYLKENGCTALEMEIVKAYFELDAATRQKIFEAFERIHSRIATAKEQLAAADAATAGGSPEVKAPQEMTVAELHAELDRQIAEEKKRVGGQSVFGRGSSETATG